MSSWSALSIAVPLCSGLVFAYPAFGRSTHWYNKLAQTRYTIPYRLLLPLFSGLLTIQGIAAYLISNASMLSSHEAAISGQWGLGFYWLSLTFLFIWPWALAFGPSTKMALGVFSISALLQFLAMIQFFRTSTPGGLLMLLCTLIMSILGGWNALLVRAESANNGPFELPY